ncbi:MAG TPA: phosphatidylserine decarboxylase family protein [Thermoanaerobaculia bacterium]|nr:phosphatidylserine decarboxylase family protein [Thermoanaerobaculia bacterium]
MYSERAIEAKYRRQFGYLAGYLPRDRGAVDDFHRDLAKTLSKLKGEQRDVPSVAALRRLIDVNGIIRMYVVQMIDEVPKKHRQIKSTDEMLAALNHIVRTAPLYTPIKKKQNFFPVSTLFTYMMMTPAGEAIFRNDIFNGAIRAILNEWCRFLDSRESQYVLNTGVNGWLSPPAYKMNKLEEFIIPDKSAPHWGWESFNAYFHRQIKPECRPVDAPNDPKVIVSANDGTVYMIAREVKRSDAFWIKGQPYSLVNMLNNTEYVDRFVGGDVFQSFLSGADYHRWRSPIAGTVRYAKVVDGLMFSDAESAGYDPTAGTYSQGYEASVNARGLVFIESDDPVIGLVCVIPIGITEISSVTIQVKPGDRLKKGDELGYFSYGGSSMALVFQPGAIKRFTVKQRHGNPDDGPPIKVNARIAIAN